MAGTKGTMTMLAIAAAHDCSWVTWMEMGSGKQKQKQKEKQKEKQTETKRLLSIMTNDRHI